MSSRNWLLKYLKLVTALWVGCPPPTFPKKSTKNSSFFQKWRNLSYNKTNKTQGEHYGIQSLWRNHS